MYLGIFNIFLSILKSVCEQRSLFNYCQENYLPGFRKYCLWLFIIYLKSGWDLASLLFSLEQRWCRIKEISWDNKFYYTWLLCRVLCSLVSHADICSVCTCRRNVKLQSTNGKVAHTSVFFRVFYVLYALIRWKWLFFARNTTARRWHGIIRWKWLVFARKTTARRWPEWSRWE